MKEPSRITVGELNVQGEKWKRKKNDQIEKQIIDVFEMLKKASAKTEQKCQDTSESLDVIVLTAVCNAQREIIQKLNEYEWRVSNNGNRPDRYSVVIGLKKSLDDFKLIEAVSDRSTQDIDLLKVRFEAKGQSFTVIGCRFTTGIDKKKLTVERVSESGEGGYTTWAQEMKKQYDSECVAFCTTLLPFIRKSIDDNMNDIFILAGDFNNARCHGDLRKNYNPQNYVECSQINYNLHLIKDWLEPYGFKMADIDRDGEPIPTHKKFPIDHIFVRGLNFKVKKCEPVQTDALSDHAIIWAEFESDANEE